MTTVYHRLRQILLPVFARVNPGDITIRHHHTRDRFRVHSFRHKDYWFHGKAREADTMRLLAALVEPGDVVVDVGAHIGYLTLYLSALVGDEGRVFAFEPGPDNLRYLRRNTAPKANIRVIGAAVGSAPGAATFFVENLSGQNNSLLRDYQGLRENARSANLRPSVEEVAVEVVSLGDYFAAAPRAPRFVKIDVEGFEVEAVKGCLPLLERARPTMLVEIWPANHQAVWDLIVPRGYRAFEEDGTPIDRLTATVPENVLFVPTERAADAERALTRSPRRSLRSRA